MNSTTLLHSTSKNNSTLQHHVSAFQFFAVVEEEGEKGRKAGVSID